MRVLYFAVFPMNTTLLKFNFQDLGFVTLLQYMAKMFVWYLSLRKQFVREIRKINPTRNLKGTYGFQCRPTPTLS